jgi:hypothetical protein
MTMQSPTQTTPVPHWIVPFADLVRIFELAEPRLRRFDHPAHPLIFSCSVNGIWPTTCLGPTPVCERVMIGGQSALLDATADLLMHTCDSTRGGRFTVTLDGVFRTRDGAVLAQIELTA